ncbi:MAG: hypothetical protein ACOC0N_05460 [Chroococcales cyanobacterium]
MQNQGILLSLLLGVSTPALVSVIDINAPAIAQSSLPTGQWLGGNFEVNISYYNNALHYEGYDLRNGASIELSGAQVSGSPQRRIYTWQNGNYRYQVAWRPNDSDVIRLQVFAPSGRQLVNTLMYNVLSP